jgi:hypothetical protein
MIGNVVISRPLVDRLVIKLNCEMRRGRSIVSLSPLYFQFFIQRFFFHFGYCQIAAKLVKHYSSALSENAH